jgi:GNAT superfamily N-acetyltransferase
LLEDGFELGWAEYTKLSEIDINPDRTSFIVKYFKTNIRDERVKFLEFWFIPQGFSIEDSSCLQDGFPVTQASLDSKTAFFFAGLWNNELIIRCLDRKYLDQIREFLNCYHDVREVEYQAEIPHGVKSFKIGEYIGMEYSGIKDSENTIELYPFKFYEVKKRNLIIAKAIVSYYNGEMSDTAPNIELIEVVKRYRGKGIGKELVRFIEEQAKSEGFNHILVEDMNTSLGFWESLGYEVDIDEARKDLV